MKYIKITENSFKVHSSCRHTHQPVDMVLALKKEEGFQYEDIDHILIKTYAAAVAVAGNPNPKTVYGAKFSIAYCTALALVNGRASLPDFTEERLFDPSIRSLMEKIKVVVDEKIDQEYPEKWASELDLQLKDGRSFVRKVDFPKGDPENPVNEQEMIEKFKMMTISWPQQQIEKYIQDTLQLEKIETIEDWFDERRITS